jgi:hypothetical protein
MIAVTNNNARIEELLEAMFSMRSMSRTYKVSQDKIREEHKFK